MIRIRIDRLVLLGFSASDALTAADALATTIQRELAEGLLELPRTTVTIGHLPTADVRVGETGGAAIGKEAGGAVVAGLRSTYA